MKKLDLTGERFGKWVAVRRSDKATKAKPFWECRCDCGNIVDVFLGSLRCGDSTRCAACHSLWMRESGQARINATKHGMHKSPEYQSWRCAKARCFRPNNHNYPSYGGRGITMCKAWKDDFAAFFKDMGLKPTKKHSLDRIDADGDYGPSNCKWSTMKEQNRNKRNSRGIVLTIDGVDMNVWDAMELFGTTVSYPAVVGRLKRGWDHKEAVTYDARKAHSGAAVRKKVDRSTVVLLIVGKTMSIKDAVSHFGNVVSYASALGRIRRGWDHKKAVSTPTRKKRENKA